MGKKYCPKCREVVVTKALPIFYITSGIKYCKDGVHHGKRILFGIQGRGYNQDITKLLAGRIS
ncbi:MAG: hypothetical protein KAR07_08265 [Spirochaetes bacterium]|nr:hypothetical protein [Spirochaetota bacterium]